MGLRRIRPEFVSKDFEYVIDVEFQLQAFHTYLKSTKQIIEDELKSQLLKYEKIMQEDMESYLEAGFDFSEYDVLRQTEQLYYNSIFISLYSFLEKKMFQVCRITEQKHVLKIHDVKGNGIYKYYEYLTKCSSVDFKPSIHSGRESRALIGFETNWSMNLQKTTHSILI